MHTPRTVDASPPTAADANHRGTPATSPPAKVVLFPLTDREGRIPSPAGGGSTSAAVPAVLGGTLKSRRRQRRMLALDPANR